MKYVEQAEILKNEAIIPAVWQMKFHAPQIARTARPGQFVNVHYDGGTTFLRRPFGIVDTSTEGTVTIIYRIVGTGTEELSRLHPGDVLNVEGPLGDGVFTTPLARSCWLGAASGWHRSFSWQKGWITRWSSWLARRRQKRSGHGFLNPMRNIST